jgi:hypothetical protein
LRPPHCGRWARPTATLERHFGVAETILAALASAGTPPAAATASPVVAGERRTAA